MKNAVAKFLFDLTADEIRSLRSQAEKLLARNEVLVDERDRLRQELIEARRDETGILKNVLDGMRHDSGLISIFGLGPQPADVPRGDVARMTSLRAERRAQAANEEFLATHELTPNNGWDDDAKPTN